MNTFSFKPAARLAGQTAYRPQPRKGDLLRLDANEGLAPPTGFALEALQNRPEALGVYPSAANLERDLAERHSVDPDRILVTAGGDDALARICMATLEPDRRAVLTTPTFEMIPKYIALAGAEPIAHEWWEGDFPADAFTDSITPGATAFIVTPNNPTGLSATRTQIERIARDNPEALIVLDVAYAEFDDDDPTDLARVLPNVVAVRSFSKSRGLAGLRIGYAIGPAPLVESMRITGQPFAVSALSIEVARMSLAHDQRRVDAVVAQVKKERKSLAEALTNLGSRALPSQANFILARFASAPAIHAALLERGIAVRAFPKRQGLESALRITCPGEPMAFARLIDALESIAEESPNWFTGDTR